MLKPQKKLRSADRTLALLRSHSELAHFPALFFQLQGSASHVEKDDQKKNKNKVIKKKKAARSAHLAYILIDPQDIA